ncbi:MAG: class I SAM-dependent methyltransferase [Alphaproteobacteria bacterium]
MAKRPQRPPGRQAKRSEPAAEPGRVSDLLMAHAGIGTPRPAPPEVAERATYFGFMALAETTAKDGDLGRALQALDSAAKADPAAAAPHYYRAQVLGRLGRSADSLRSLVTAIRLEPGQQAAKTLLARVIGREPGLDYRWIDADVVRACLATPGIGHQDFADIAQTLLVEGPLHETLVKGATKGWEAAVSDLLGAPGRRLRADPLLLDGLRQGLVVHVPLERLLGAARRSILLGAWSGRERGYADFVGAIAEQCFLNEYVWFVTDEERLALQALSPPALDTADLEPTLLRLALYGPLDGLAVAGALVASAARFTAPVRRLIELTIVEPRADRAAAEAVPRLTETRDATSRAVQAQYEEFPYPRWRGLTLPAVGSTRRVLERDFGKALVGRLPARPRVLVAGCGTGAHAIPCAVRYGAEAEVVAIDLSRASLGYAARRAELLGVAGIGFAQADILELDPATPPFDVIECSGVLHHLADPGAGARALAGLLAPGGLMTLGLYSERARRHVGEAIAAARARGTPPTADGIRDFRHWMLADPPGPWAVPLARYRDFYATSQCRDLLFHVQEHRFTPLGIKALLADAGLEFRGFQLPAAVLDAYRRTYPRDPAGLELDNWDAFEAAHPDTFRTLYQFWCVKPA